MFTTPASYFSPHGKSFRILVNSLPKEIPFSITSKLIEHEPNVHKTLRTITTGEVIFLFSSMNLAFIQYASNKTTQKYEQKETKETKNNFWPVELIRDL